MSIDWSKAPEWAIAHALYVSPDSQVKAVWVGEHQFQQVELSRSFPYGGGAGEARHNPTLAQFKYETPRPSAWKGEGLPPVGTVCEVLNSNLGSPAWEQCAVLFTGKHLVVYNSESCEERTAHIDYLEFRPIRTPEQIAAEERGWKIKDLYFTVNWNEGRETWNFISSTRKADYAKAIDAGWQQVKS